MLLILKYCDCYYTILSVPLFLLFVFGRLDFIFSRFNKVLKLPDYTPEEYQAYFQGTEEAEEKQYLVQE